MSETTAENLWSKTIPSATFAADNDLHEAMEWFAVAYRAAAIDENPASER